jgi:hypothetical protein
MLKCAYASAIQVIKIQDMWWRCRVVDLIMIAWFQNPSRARSCFLEQETVHLSLSTGWFQERIRECFNKLTASITN